jgi:hypothetical protein
MKKRVKHIAVAQFGKMLAAVYFVAMLPVLAIVLLAILTGVEMPSIGAGVVILFAVVYICLDSWDHVPVRSWPLFKARHVLRTLHLPDFSPIFR